MTSLPAALFDVSAEARPSLAPLVALAARVSRRPAEKVDNLTSMMLAPQRARGGRWCSSLNNDGSPLQVAVTLSAHGGRPSVRLIVDPSAEVDDVDHRWDRAGRTLAAVLSLYAPRLAHICRSVVNDTLPSTTAERAALPGGGIWLAADLAEAGMALYATAKWGAADERWARTTRWLRAVLPASHAAEKHIGRLSEQTDLVSVGVEGSEPENARVKLYWRLRGTAGLAGLRLPFFESAHVPRFLSAVVEDRRVPLAAFVGSVGFRLIDGELSDAKVDVCGHCVRRDTADWVRLIQRTIAAHELVPLFLDASAMKGTEIAFIGLGVDRHLMPRLNLYFKQHG